MNKENEIWIKRMREFLTANETIYVANSRSTFRAARHFLNSASYFGLHLNVGCRLAGSKPIRTNNFPLCRADFKEDNCMLMPMKVRRICIRYHLDLDTMIKCQILETLDLEKFNNYLMHCNDIIPANIYNYKEELQSPQWISLRDRLLADKGGKCLMCGSTQGLCVHHLNYEYGHHAWEYSDDNFIILCRKCHEKLHNIQKPKTLIKYI